MRRFYGLRLVPLLVLAGGIPWANSERFWERTPPFRSTEVERLVEEARDPEKFGSSATALARLSAYSPVYPRVGECGTGMDEAYAAHKALSRLGRRRPGTLFRLFRHPEPQVRVAVLFTADLDELPGRAGPIGRMAGKDADPGLRRHAADALDALRALIPE